MRRNLSLLLLFLGLFTAGTGVGLAFRGWAGQREAAIEFAELVHQPTPAAFSPGSVRGRISFPDLRREYFIFEGASKKNLLKGPVHVSESSNPGEPGNVIIAAHRDTHFRLLKDIKQGQEFDIEERGRVFLYRVTETHVIEPEDVRYYLPTSNAVVTLVTCYPFYYTGAAPQRYIVRAELAGIKR